MDPQLAKHQPMLWKQPDLDGRLSRQSDLTYKKFVLLFFLDVTLGIGLDFSFEVFFTRSIVPPN